LKVGQVWGVQTAPGKKKRITTLKDWKKKKILFRGGYGTERRQASTAKLFMLVPITEGNKKVPLELGEASPCSPEESLLCINSRGSAKSKQEECLPQVYKRKKNSLWI